MPFSHCWMHVQGMTTVYDQEKILWLLLSLSLLIDPTVTKTFKFLFVKSREIHSTVQKVCQRGNTIEFCPQTQKGITITDKLSYHNLIRSERDEWRIYMYAIVIISSNHNDVVLIANR